MTVPTSIRVLSVTAALLFVIAAAQGRRVDCPAPPVTCGVIEAPGACTQGFGCRCISSRCEPKIDDEGAVNGAHSDTLLQNFVLAYFWKDCFTTTTCNANITLDPFFCNVTINCFTTGTPETSQTCQYDFSTVPPTTCTPN